MTTAIAIPRQGWTMEEGTFVGWLKQDGDHVRIGEALFTLESDKATADIEAIDAGILHIPATAPQPGETVKVGAVIGYLMASAEPVPEAKEGVKSGVTRLAISPRARRLAKKLGVSTANLKGSGRTGRIRERDIQATANVEQTSVPVSALRKTIAQRLLASHRNSVPVTLTTNVDASNLVNLRNQFKASPEIGGVPSFTDFVVKLLGIALPKHPFLNARWRDEEIEHSRSIHIGVAVDTEAGLLVPVVRNVQQLPLKEVAIQTRKLIARARSRQLCAEEMQGGTFTVTNLGAYGIDAFTPIINQPESAILGMGRIQKQPVVMGDAIVIRERLTLNLTFDHRVVDGAPAARFLQTVTMLIENPGPWLIDGGPS